MTHPRRPPLPLPPPLRGAEIGSFAHKTVVERLPRIVRRVLEENDFSPAVVNRLQTLLDEIPEHQIRLLRDTTAPDTAEWSHYVSPHLDRNWLQVPWFFAETYFYRRILEATGYFYMGPEERVDPFAPHKAQSMKASRAAIRQLGRRLEAWRAEGWDGNALERLLKVALWGNQGDLSMWPGGAAEQPERPDDDEAMAYVLVDDAADAGSFLARAAGRAGNDGVRVDVLMDNAGFELVSDLALVDYLLDSGRAAAVHLHLKPHPLFVSDALVADLRETVAALTVEEEEAVCAFGERLHGYLEARCIVLDHDYFWTSPLPAWEMPADLRGRLAASHLVISKGDANYRRLLGDRHWAFSTPFARIVSYFPAPLLALRTLKSEVAVGLPADRVVSLNSQHPGWTTSGRWGMIQFSAAGETD